MGKVKSVIVLVICFSLFGFMAGTVSAQQEIILPIAGGVYHMITSPVLPEDPDPQVSLVDDLGAYDKTEWRLFRYDPAGSKYIELKTDDWGAEQDFNFGRGYWIISRNPTDVDIQGDPAGVDQIELKGMPARELWNQIGSIYLQDFTIGMFPNCNLWVTPKSGGISFQLNDPLNPYTHVTLKEYAGGSSYTDIGDELGEMLEAKKGYWLKNIWDEDVILSFDPAGLTSVSTTNSTTNFPSQDFFARVAQQEDPPDPPPGITGSFSSGSGGGSVGCFIATAAYRDYDHPKVQILREFRDRYLSTNGFGTMFVDMYCRFSPTLANFVVNRDSVKTLIRFTLMPIVGLNSLVIRMNAYGFPIFLAFPMVMGFLFLIESGGGGGRCKPKFSIKSEEGKRKR